jgi:hypothetical protein
MGYQNQNKIMKNLLIFIGTFWEKLDLKDFPMVSIKNIFMNIYLADTNFQLGFSRLEYKNRNKKESRRN